MDRYLIYRSTTSTGTYTLIDSVSASPYRDSVPTSQTTYYYKIAGVLSGMRSGLSAYGSGYRVSIAYPAAVSATDSLHASVIVVTWAASSSAQRYIISRSTSSTGTFTPVDTIVTGLTSIDSNIAANTVYYYKVTACYRDDRAVSVTAERGSTARVPAAPLLTSTVNGIQVTVVRPTTGATYRIYTSRLPDTTYSLLTSVTSPSYSYSQANVPADYAMHRYRITLYSSYGEGARSLPDSARRTLPAPGNVGAYSGVDIAGIYWTHVDSAVYYRIERSTYSGSQTVLYDSTSDTSYADRVLDESYYYYGVAAVHSSKARSALSSAVSSQRLQAPQAPGWVTALSDTARGRVTVSWQTATATFVVYRSVRQDFSTASLVDTTSGSSLVDTLRSDSIYYYRVKARNGAGESVLSPVSNAAYRTPTTAPRTPDTLTASANDPSVIYLSWINPEPMSAMVRGIIVYRALAQSGPFTALDTVTMETNYFTDTRVTLSYPTAYWYRLVAYNEAGQSAPTTEVIGYRGKP